MSRNIYDAVRPLHILSRLSGFALFTIDRKTFELFFTKFDILSLLFNLFMTTTLNYIYWNTYFSINIHSSELVKHFFPTFAYINCCWLTCAKVFHFYHRHSFVHFIKLINEIDTDLEQLNFKFDFEQQRNIVIKLMFCVNVVQSFLALITYYAQKYYEMGIGWNVFIFVSWGFFVNLVMMTQFITSVCSVRERFKAVNHIIK